MTGPKPFDRAAAKAAGYSDAEIDAYLTKQAPAPTSTFDRAGAKAAGYSDAEIDAHLAANAPKPSAGDEFFGGLASASQGASLGVAGLLSKDLKKASDEFNQRHKYIGGGLNVAGTVAGGLATAPFLPEAWAAKVLGKALIGGGAAAVSAGANGDGTVTQRLKRAAIAAPLGAVAGVALPAAAETIAGKAKGFLQPRFFKKAFEAEAGAHILPPDAAAILARREALAPGTTVPAALEPDLARVIRTVGANKRVVTNAVDESKDRLVALKGHLDAMGPKYENALTNNGTPIIADPAIRGGPNIASVLGKNGHNPTLPIDLRKVQALRGEIRAERDVLWKRAQAGKGGGNQVHELGQDYKTLTSWLENHAPAITSLDRDFKVLSDSRRAEELITKNLKQARVAHASTDAAGMAPASPGSAIAKAKQIINDMIAPSPAKLARANYETYLRPGLPKHLLNARNRILGPQKNFGLLGSLTIGSQVPRGLLALDPQEENR